MRFARLRAYILLSLIFFASVLFFPTELYASSNAQQLLVTQLGAGDNWDVADCVSDNPNGGISGDAASAVASDNAEAIFKFFISNNFVGLGNKPMNAVQAAGWLGNIQVESNFNPATIQGGKPYDSSKAMNSGVSGYAFGIVQWDGGRRVNMLKAGGDNWKDLGFQLDYIKGELDGPESRILKDSEFQNTDDPAVAATRIDILYERSDGSARAKRQQQARDYYALYKDTAPGTPISNSSSSVACNDNNSVGDGSIANVARTMAEWNGTYRWGGGHDQVNKPKLQETIDNKFYKEGSRTFNDAPGQKASARPNEYGVDCSGFVRAAIFQATGIDIYDGTPTRGFTANEKSANSNSMLTRISNKSEAQPGDVFITPRNPILELS